MDQLEKMRHFCGVLFFVSPLHHYFVCYFGEPIGILAMVHLPQAQHLSPLTPVQSQTVPKTRAWRVWFGGGVQPGFWLRCPHLCVRCVVHHWVSQPPQDPQPPHRMGSSQPTPFSRRTDPPPGCQTFFTSPSRHRAPWGGKGSPVKPLGKWVNPLLPSPPPGYPSPLLPSPPLPFPSLRASVSHASWFAGESMCTSTSASPCPGGCKLPPPLCVCPLTQPDLPTALRLPVRPSPGRWVADRRSWPGTPPSTFDTSHRNPPHKLHNVSVNFVPISYQCAFLPNGACLAGT